MCSRHLLPLLHINLVKKFCRLDSRAFSNLCFLQCRYMSWLTCRYLSIFRCIMMFISEFDSFFLMYTLLQFRLETCPVILIFCFSERDKTLHFQYLLMQSFQLLSNAVFPKRPSSSFWHSSTSKRILRVTLQWSKVSKGLSSTTSMFTLLQYLGPFPDCLLFRCLDPIPDGLTLGYLGLSLDCVNYGNLDPFPNCLTPGDLETFHVCLVFSFIFPYRPLFVRHHPWLTSTNLLLLWKTVFYWWHFSPLTPGSRSEDCKNHHFLCFFFYVSSQISLTCVISRHDPPLTARFDVLITIQCCSLHNHTYAHLSLHLKSLWSALGHVHYRDPDDPDFFTEPLSFHKVLWLHADVTSNYFWIRRIFGT